ncbi:MAG TPA: Glu/Leu/Phe/Val dehydrogenase [Trichormus sp.]|jgi:glutamate dehydrogenase (NAD(P)+)
MSTTISKKQSTDAVTTYTNAAIEQLHKLDPATDPDFLRAIMKPKREIVVEVPLRRDDGKYVTYQGYRVQHNDARGPFKGGLRFHPSVDLNEARTLAHLMSLKTAVVNIPFGGGKGGIAVDPRSLSMRELETLTRNFTNLLGDNIGPLVDIPAPDVNTNGQTMAWIVDEYCKRRGQNLGVITGKPIELGGSLGRDEATGRGVMYAARDAAKEKNVDLKKATVVFQGFGNLASFGSRLMEQELGSKVIGVSSSQGAIYNKNGIDLDAAERYYHKNKGMKGFPNVEWMTNDELLVQECDILIPSALEKAITPANAPKIKAKIIVEGANDCTEAEADSILNERGIFVVPDILANAGGVVVSYFEWVQNLNNHYWDIETVRKELEKIMVSAYNRVSATANEHHMTMRVAAYTVAIQRIARAMSLRGA